MWKAEQQLGEPVDTTRGVSSSCQFCEQAKQNYCAAWIALNYASEPHPWWMELKEKHGMASLILAQDKRWRRA